VSDIFSVNENSNLGGTMGMRGPDSMASRIRRLYGPDPEPETAPNSRRVTLLRRLQNLARGTGLSVELGAPGTVVITAGYQQAEAIMVREREGKAAG
jgi:hypothetical protein